MIIGIGIDLIEVTRIQAAWQRHGDRFLNRILLPDEIAYCKTHTNPAPFIAARFAAKEAVSKAFGCGIGSTLGWHDIEIRRRDTGQPYVVMQGKGIDLLALSKANQIHLTLTHTSAHTAAVAILEQLSHLTNA